MEFLRVNTSYYLGANLYELWEVICTDVMFHSKRGVDHRSHLGQGLFFFFKVRRYIFIIPSVKCSLWMDFCGGGIYKRMRWNCRGKSYGLAYIIKYINFPPPCPSQDRGTQVQELVMC